MSKSIWHTADKTPEEDRVIVVKSKRTGEYLVGSEFEFILDHFTKWAYFDDLLALETELKHTRKALDVAVDAIKNATEYLGNQEPLVDVMAMNLHTDLSKVLEQITALEQKDK
jgi:hypothetical protein